MGCTPPNCVPLIHDGPDNVFASNIAIEPATTVVAFGALAVRFRPLK